MLPICRKLESSRAELAYDRRVDLFAQLSGVAQARGIRWAESVARVCPIDKPWPDTERMWAIARRKVDDLATSDPETQARLAGEVVDGARHWWNLALEQAD